MKTGNLTPGFKNVRTIDLLDRRWSGEVLSREKAWRTGRMGDSR
jgi:hypothetical protein